MPGNGGAFREPPYPRKDGVPPSARMCRSAISSSSPVLTPGATASSIAWIASAVMRPATRIFAISSADL